MSFSSWPRIWQCHTYWPGVENMALTAWDMGIGSCWIGAFSEDGVKRVLNIPANFRVVSLLTLGYADEAQDRRTGKR
jgi:nitroreductase